LSKLRVLAGDKYTETFPERRDLIFSGKGRARKGTQRQELEEAERSPGNGILRKPHKTGSC